MDWRDILHVELTGSGLNIYVGAIVGAGIVVLLVASWAVGAARGRRWRITKANFSFAGYGQVEVSPNNEVANIAHKAWVEMRTRKAAMPFDTEHDVIVEVYNSWYELFRTLRELAKNVPADQMRANSDAALIVEVLLAALNMGLRPHLTEWQARLRRWEQLAVGDSEHAGLSPQELQRLFPHYEALVSDLVKVNRGLVDFSEQLRRIAHERRRTVWPRWPSRPERTTALQNPQSG